MKANDILDIHLTKMITEKPEIYNTLDEMKGLPEYQVFINAMIEYAKAKATEAMREIEKDCKIHKTKAGDEFSGISWAQVSRIMEKHGYEAKIPF